MLSGHHIRFTAAFTYSDQFCRGASGALHYRASSWRERAFARATDLRFVATLAEPRSCGQDEKSFLIVQREGFDFDLLHAVEPQFLAEPVQRDL